MSSLKQFETILHEENFDCSIVKTGDIEKLLLFLGHDSSDREKILEITSQTQVLPPESKLSYLNNQYLIVLPFSPKAHTINELNSGLNFINSTIEFPGFQYHEMDNKISFRYVQLSSGVPDKKLLLATVGLILINVDLFSETLEYLASGKSTFYELLKQAAQISKKLHH